MTAAAPGTSRQTRRIAAISWVTVSWVATASSSTTESSARIALPCSTPVPATTDRTASKIRSGRPDAASRRRQYVSVEMKPLMIQGQPARDLPPQVAAHRRDRVPVGQVMQGLQHQHRRRDLTRQARPPRRSREQVREQLRPEHLTPVPRQEREHAARRNQMPHQRRRIQ